ncbi:hypothetical protein [Stutzerimonas stutzeri]|uniref:hypothetical protein n=1 Tax=Stutzerimonas stutzeri TaxID=316 RepID=UPI001BD116AF|nr:hypothetical protein [Stutzerimonas stutzeri]
MKQPANDETFANDPCISVTLHARYLLALKNHRRKAFIAGMFWGALASWIVYSIVPRALALIGRFS